MSTQTKEPEGSVHGRFLSAIVFVVSGLFASASHASIDGVDRIRITSSSTSSSNALQIAEVIAIDATSGADVARSSAGATVQATSVLQNNSGFAADFAIDGFAAPGRNGLAPFFHSGNTANQSLVVQLAQPIALQQLTLVGRADACCTSRDRYTVELLNSNSQVVATLPDLRADVASHNVTRQFAQAGSSVNDGYVGGAFSAVQPWPFIPVSAANLPDGRIVAWASNERSSFPQGPEFTYTGIWDPQTDQFTEIPHPSHDMFCSHHVMLEDGTVFVSGGRNQGNSPWTSTFDYETEEWVQQPNMNRGRWYPTSVAMPDGRVMTTIGSGGGNTAEIWNGVNDWSLLGGLNFDEPILNFSNHGESNWWPLMHLAPDGRIFHSGPTPTMHMIDVAGGGSLTETNTHSSWYPKHGATVMYEEGKLLTAGGWNSGTNGSSTNRSLVIDLNGPSPQVNEISPMVYPRKFHNGVLLPNGEVLVFGGNTSGQKFSDSGSIFAAEAWNPDTQQWRELASAAVPRNYHSTALLMLDGRVFTGGGGLCNCAADHQDAEIYTPPYLYRADGTLASRPVISRVPGVTEAGAVIPVVATHGLRRFALIKMSSTTHGMNTDVRNLNVPFVESAPGQYSLELHPNVNVLTPGYWMLFAMDAAGVPSIAKVVRISTQGLESGPPVLKNLVSVDARQSTPFGLALVHSDPDGDALTFSAQGLPSGLSINPVSGIISGVPQSPGAANVLVTVSDGSAATSDSFTLNVVSDSQQQGVNYEYYQGAWSVLPNFNQLTPITTGTGAGFGLSPRLREDDFGFRFTTTMTLATGGNYTFYTTSDDGSQLFVNGTMVVNNDGLHGPQERSGSINLAAGEHNLVVTFFERTIGQTLSVQYAGPGISKRSLPASILSVESSGGGGGDQAPVLTTPADQTTEIGGVAALQIAAFDPDGTPITFSATGLPDGASINAATGLISGVLNAPGFFGVNVAATDGFASASASFVWNVVADNVAPILSVPGAQTGTVGQGVSLSLNGSDANGDVLNYSATNLPNGVSIGASSGIISGSYQSAGNFVSTITLSDGSQTDSATISWSVAVQNQAPVLSNPGNQSSTVGTAAFLGLSATDANGDNIAFSAQGLPSGLSLNGSQITGTLNALGNFSVQVTASDGSLSDTRTFNWNVTSVPDPLNLQPLFAAPVEAGTSQTYIANATGGAGLEYRWSFGDGDVLDFSTANQSVQHSFDEPGRYLVSVTVRDGTGSTSHTFTQAVHGTATTQAPVNDSTIVQVPGAGNGTVWNVNPDNGSIAVIDIASRTRIAEIAVGQYPASLAYLPALGEVWVANRDSASISRISASNRNLLGTVQLDANSRPYGLVAAGSGALVILEARGEIIRVNSAGSVINRVALGSNVRHLAVDAARGRVLVSRFVTPPLPGESGNNVQTSSGGQALGGEVLVLNSASLAQLTTVILPHSFAQSSEHSGPGLPNYLRAPAIAPDGSAAWVPSKQDNIRAGLNRDGTLLDHDHSVRSITSRIGLDSLDANVNERIDLDNASTASAAAFGTYGSYLFVALEGNRMVAVIDAYRGEEQFRIPTGRAPSGVVMAPDGRTLFVHNFLDRTVSIHDVSPLIERAENEASLIASVDVVGTERLDASVLLGKQLFHDALDPRLSRETYMSCASCHNDGGHDGRSWDFSQFGEGIRNTTTLRGQGGTANGVLHWTGNFDEVQDFEGQIRDFAGGTGFLEDSVFNASTRADSLGAPKAGLNADLDALAAYLDSLSTSDPSPVRAAAGLSPLAATGRDLFLAGDCTSCHEGSNTTDSALDVRHAIGSITSASGGRRGEALDGFDTPTLLGVWDTAPYLHDGSADTLQDAITAHSGLGLNNTEVNALAAFLLEIDVSDLQIAGGTQNVALGKPTQSSSELQVGLDLGPTRANDGNRDGDFGAGSLTHTDFDNQPYWQVDLQGSFDLARIEIYNREDCCAEALADFHVLVSDQPFASESLSATLAQPGVTNIAFAGVAGRTTVLNIGRTARFVRVQLSGSEYLQLAEVEVYGSPAAGGPTNFPPSLTNPGSQTSQLGVSINLAIQASDLELDPISFSATNLPPGLQLNPNSGFISGSPSAPGGYSVSVAASDGTTSTNISFSWTVTSGAIPENLALGKPARQSSDLAIPVDLSAAKAVDGNTNGNFGASSLSHTDFDASAWWEVDLTGNYALTDVRVFNREDCCSDALSAFYVLVSDTPIPTGSLDSVRATPGVSSYFVAGTGGRPSTVPINTTGRYVRVQLSRAEYLQLAEVQVFGIALSGSSNFAPALANPGEQSSSLTESVDLALSAVDPDGDLLSFSASGLPAGLSIDESTGAISGTPTTVGSFSVQASVSDGVETTGVNFEWTIFDGVAPTNLALGGVASQSSVFAGLDFLDADRANDGNRDGNFEAGSLTHTDLDVEAWWQIDLGNRYQLQRIELYNRTDCCSESLSNFYVLVSDQPFSDAGLTSQLSNPAVTAFSVPFAAGADEIVGLGITGRYVRVQLAGTDYLQLAEVEVYGGPL